MKKMGEIRVKTGKIVKKWIKAFSIHQILSGFIALDQWNSEVVKSGRDK